MKVRVQHILWLIVGCSILLLSWLSLHEGRWTVPNEDSPGQKIEVLTSEGRRLILSQASVPSRIISTYPGATELLIDLGVSDRIVGTVKPYGEEPERYRIAYDRLPLLEAPYMPTREEVLALEPDMIIGWAHHFTPSGLGDSRNWVDRDVLPYVVPATVRKGYPTLENTVYPFIEDMGQVFQIPDRAHTYLGALQRRVDAVEAKTRTMSYHPSVVILQAHGQSTYSLYGPIYMIDDIVKKAGGRNLVTQQMSGIGPERVLGFDPDYIIYVAASQKSGRHLTESEAKEELMMDTNLSHMRAIQEGKIIVVPFSDVNNGNGRVVDALEIISKAW